MNNFNNKYSNYILVILIIFSSLSFWFTDHRFLSTLTTVLFTSLLIYKVLYTKYISLDDLPISTSYRYTLFFLLTVIGSMLYLISFYSSKISDILTIIGYPYLREEIRKLMYNSFEGPLGTICFKIITLIFKYKTFKYIFFIIHFIIFCLYRLVLVSLFVWCCFFNGNFVFFILLSPLSFLIWLLTFFIYYFTIFLESNTNYIKDVFIVSFKNDIYTDNSRYIRICLNDLSFELSPFGKEEGFTENDISSIVFKDVGLQIGEKTILIYSRDMNDLRTKSGGKYSPGHPIYGEESGTKYRIDGSFTKGNPEDQNSIPTLPSTIDGKKSLPQNRIPVDKPFEVDLKDLHGSIPGSEAKLKNIKDMLDKDDQQKDKNDNDNTNT
jgi:hypothetical protein